MTSKNYRPCIAFKLNYCDGGKNFEHVGFGGICSDAIIKYNIKIKNRRWCSHEDCACRKYFDKKISRDDLEEIFYKNFFICYESVAFHDWDFKAGLDYDGKPRMIRGAKKGHLCLLTTVEPNMPESSRMVVAMFIIGKIFEGNEDESGFVCANDNFDYCLEFSPNEARKMKFWEIYQNPNAADTIKWGSGLFRYFSDEDAVKFLEMAVEAKLGTDDETFAKDFLKNYCELNNLSS